MSVQHHTQCPSHEVLEERQKRLEQAFETMRNDLTECSNAIKESAILINNTSKSIEKFNSSLDVLADKIKSIEIDNIGRKAWEEKRADLERTFNNRLIVLFTALGALAAVTAVLRSIYG